MNAGAAQESFLLKNGTLNHTAKSETNNADTVSNTSYDVLIIGAGAAGSTVVDALCKQGRRVALIEKDKMGGTCLNYGCDPTKTMLYTAELLYQAQNAGPYGIHIDSAKVEWSSLLKRIEQVQNEMRGGTPEEANQAMRKRGVDLVIGQAKFVSPHAVEVNGQRLEADKFLIATGVRSAIPNVPGLEEAGYITNKRAVSLPQLPERLAIIGGGQLGIEFAQIFSRFGVEVAVFEGSERIMSGDDAELVAELRQILTGEGIRIETGAKLVRVEQIADGKRLSFEDGSTHTVDEILLAAGRTPNIETLNLDAAGVESDPQKGILVDETLRTSVDHIWAGGDVAGAYRFTHVAENHGEVIVHNMTSNTPKAFDPTVISWATYTDPSLATVGRTEEELGEKGIAYRVFTQKFSEIPKALATGWKAGRVKLLVGEDDSILGGHILAKQAGDLLAPIILAMQCQLPISAVADTTFPYPTLVEGVSQAAKSARS